MIVLTPDLEDYAWMIFVIQVAIPLTSVWLFRREWDLVPRHLLDFQSLTLYTRFNFLFSLISLGYNTDTNPNYYFRIGTSILSSSYAYRMYLMKDRIQREE